jgi:hypothetical protein
VFLDRPATPGASTWRGLLLSALVVTGVTLALLGCGDKLRESSYHTMSDAKKDGAIERGWIPDYLPASSRDIHEMHRISNPTTWCSFTFLPGDSETLRKKLRGAGTESLSVARVERPGTTWWPTFLDGTLDISKVHQAGYELYGMEEPERTGEKRASVYLFAVDWASGRALFYQTTRGSRELPVKPPSK